MFAFKSEAAALKSVVALFKAGISPSILEFLDRQSVGCAENYTGKVVFEGHSRSSILLIELDGTEAEVRKQRKALLEFMEGRAVASREARRCGGRKALAGPAHLFAVDVLDCRYEA